VMAITRLLVIFVEVCLYGRGAYEFLHAVISIETPEGKKLVSTRLLTAMGLFAILVSINALDERKKLNQVLFVIRY
jgi:hypothetical protein